MAFQITAISFLLLFLDFVIYASQVNVDIARNQINKHQIVVYSNRSLFIYNTTNKIIASNLHGNLPFGLDTTKEIDKCDGYYACRLIDKKFETGYNLDLEKIGDFRSLIYRESANSSECSLRGGRTARVHTYCDTHYNPTTHFTSSQCKDSFEWHSPFACNYTSLSNEYPCFVYDSDGHVRDLTPLVQSDGQSYKVDTTRYEFVRDMYINVCNEAHDKCSPMVSACYTNIKKAQMFEIGYSNSTEHQSIKWDSNRGLVTLIYYGHYLSGHDKRYETIIRFVCPKQHGPANKPHLLDFNDTTSVIEWQTTHACAREEVERPATDCKINGFGMGVDLHDLSYGQDVVVVDNLNLKGEINNRMTIGICSGLKSKMLCGQVGTKTTSACLESYSKNKTITGAKVVGNIRGGTIRLTDTMIVLDYPGTEICHSDQEEDNIYNNQNSTTSKPVESHYSKTISTRIEYKCDPRAPDKHEPRFLGLEECTYTFEWPSKHLCREMAIEHDCEVKINETFSLDLRLLYRGEEGEPWSVIPLTPRFKMQGQILLNVCGLLQHDNYDKHCNSSASICWIDQQKESKDNITNSINLGIYDHAQYEPETNNIKLFYTDGSQIGNVRRQTIVTLVCDESSDTSPKLTTLNLTSPISEIIWHTKVACISNSTMPPKHEIAPQTAPSSSTTKPAVSPPTPMSQDTHELSNSSNGTSVSPEPRQGKNSVGHDMHLETKKMADNLISGSKMSHENEHFISSVADNKFQEQQSPQSGELLDERSHRFLMISLIVFSFVSCGIIIFIIHNKTRIPRSLREFRMNREQMVSPQFSYRRVLNAGESGDL